MQAAKAPAFWRRDEWQSHRDTCDDGNVAPLRVPAKLCQAVLQPWGLHGVSSLMGMGMVQEQPPNPSTQQQHQCKQQCHPCLRVLGLEDDTSCLGSGSVGPLHLWGGFGLVSKQENIWWRREFTFWVKLSQEFG